MNYRVSFTNKSGYIKSFDCLSYSIDLGLLFYRVSDCGGQGFLPLEMVDRVYLMDEIKEKEAKDEEKRKERDEYIDRQNKDLKDTIKAYLIAAVITGIAIFAYVYFKCH